MQAKRSLLLAWSLLYRHTSHIYPYEKHVGVSEDPTTTSRRDVVEFFEIHPGHVLDCHHKCSHRRVWSREWRVDLVIKAYERIISSCDDGVAQFADISDVRTVSMSPGNTTKSSLIQQPSNIFFVAAPLDREP